jgi:hypothetical protein
VNCPADPGGRTSAATAYSPKTDILYMPLNEFCSNTTPRPLNSGQAYTGGGRAIFARVAVPNSDGNVGRVDAIKLADRSTVWSYRQRAPTTSAVPPTGGGVVFGGSLDGWFREFDDSTGKVLWQTRLNNTINAFLLVQHHTLERLALALAAVRRTSLGALHEARRVQLRLHPGVAPPETVVAHQVLVEMLHVPAPDTRPVQLQHDRVTRCSPRHLDSAAEEL